MKLDQDLGVASFESQPKSFEYELGAKKVRYTPDFHVIDNNGESTFIEIKGIRYTASDRDIEKFQLLRESFDRIGIYFRVVLVDFAAQESKNLMFLHRYKSHDHLLINDVIPNFKGKIIDLINKGLNDKELASLYSAMARGEVSYKKDQKIDLNMEVVW
ncbi:TnsA endonuclease N-terminal domain-containing protein [Marinobacterium lacunae]|uniref:TnsA endonuclease N-terminal domain-containing protein n=1 Tax=Marinobacterium lacunae TaxID=1232683 RepID=UPI0018CC380B|nr:TnsA endonuclease N-terminal domain-containing protein [Marinobacterium lacunae]